MHPLPDRTKLQDILPSSHSPSLLNKEGKVRKSFNLLLFPAFFSIKDPIPICRVSLFFAITIGGLEVREGNSKE